MTRSAYPPGAWSSRGSPGVVKSFAGGARFPRQTHSHPAFAVSSPRHAPARPACTTSRTRTHAQTTQPLRPVGSLQELVTLVHSAGRLLASSPIARDSLGYSTIRFAPSTPDVAAGGPSRPGLQLSVLRMGDLLVACPLALPPASPNQGQPRGGSTLVQMLRPGLPQFGAFFDFAARASTRTVLPPLPFQGPAR